MTEIEKMYENAGVEPQYKKRTECKDGYTVGHPCEKGIACINCNRSVFEDVMPPFTAEKQLELVKWLAKIYELRVNWVKNDYSYHFVIRDYTNRRLSHSVCNYEVSFEETLAYLINRIWQSLTSQEKEGIRNILNA